jgi:hypothetical protein
MKITKRQLRRIIREEKANLAEAPRDRIKVEAGLMADLDSIATSIEEIAAGMYGLVDPMGEDPGGGDEMAGELEMQVERLTSLHAQMVAHFESMDPENQPDRPGPSGVRGDIMTREDR